MPISNADKQTVRELTKKYAEIANLPIQQERIKRMRENNDLIPGRPPVWLNELPWHELDIDGELKCKCEDSFARGIEWYFRHKLFQWKYFQADMVVENFFAHKKIERNTGLGIKIEENIIRLDDKNGICSHEYHDTLSTEADLEKLHMPIISSDKDEDLRSVDRLNDLFNGIIPVKLRGGYIYHAPWDTISMIRGAENILYDIADRPEFIHKIINFFTEAALSQADQMEAQGLLDADLSDLHCTPS